MNVTGETQLRFGKRAWRPWRNGLGRWHVRFLQQYEAGRGDYSVQRHEWLDDVDVKTLAMRIEAARHPASHGDNAARRSCCRRQSPVCCDSPAFLRGLYPSLTLP